MRRLLGRIWWKIIQRFLNAHHVGEFEGIRFADFRKRGDAFLPTMVAALQLIKTHNPQRFTRVKDHISWISNEVTINEAHAEQHTGQRWCVVDYFDPTPETDQRHWAAVWACVLVHESTHGLLARKGFQYKGRRRIQIERICVAEQNRFAKRLQLIDPELYGGLVDEYVSALWQTVWEKGLFQRIRSYWQRQHRD